MSDSNLSNDWKNLTLLIAWEGMVTDQRVKLSWKKIWWLMSYLTAMQQHKQIGGMAVICRAKGRSLSVTSLVNGWMFAHISNEDAPNRHMWAANGQIYVRAKMHVV